jgi:hypothetical protein
VTRSAPGWNCLGDPVDSAGSTYGRRDRAAHSGRGLTAQKTHFLAGLPRIDGVADSTRPPTAAAAWPPW